MDDPIQRCNHTGEVVTWYEEASDAWVGRCSRCGLLGYIEFEISFKVRPSSASEGVRSKVH